MNKTDAKGNISDVIQGPPCICLECVFMLKFEKRPAEHGPGVPTVTPAVRKIQTKIMCTLFYVGDVAVLYGSVSC